MNTSKDELLKVLETISPFIHRTPVLTSTIINEMAGCEIFFKCENFQKMGAFKMRGAMYAVSQLSKAQKKTGVVTHSSGNFAQALSLAAKSLQVPAYIVMPESAPEVKKAAVRAYGGKITQCPSTLQDRERTAKKIMEEKGVTFIHPSNDMNVILGQGTAATELLLDHPELRMVICPVGGGGLIAGTAISTHVLSTNCLCIGAEPKAADDAYRSLKSGTIESNKTATTIADGLKTMLGDVNFPIIRDHVTEIITVSEEEIIKSMRLIWERMKLVVEPSSAVALAAIFQQKEKFKYKKVGLIISGGNVDLSSLPF